jgi:transcriptional regulator with XRE-family HTH domain
LSHTAENDCQLGERLRELREKTGLSMRQLAERAGVAASYVSAVERGKISPTIHTLSRVLAALDSDLSGFFTVDPPEEFVFRHTDMSIIAESRRRYTLILPKREDIKLELLDEVYVPGESPEFEQLTGDLSGYVLMGDLVIELDGREMEVLQPGDAFYVPAGEPVRGRCAGDEVVRLITAITPPRY